MKHASQGEELSSIRFLPRQYGPFGKAGREIKEHTKGSIYYTNKSIGIKHMDGFDLF